MRGWMNELSCRIPSIFLVVLVGEGRFIFLEVCAVLARIMEGRRENGKGGKRERGGATIEAIQM